MIQADPYEDDELGFRGLHRLALSRQWHVDRDIDWDALVFEQLSPQVRESMRAIYSHIYFSELNGLQLCGRMVDLAPEGWVRHLAAVQTMDEARHVDFFRRVTVRLGGIASPSDVLLRLKNDMACIRSCYALFVHAQIVEIAAQALFVSTIERSRQLMSRAIRLPGSSAVIALSEHVLNLVGADESRHIAYGYRYLAAGANRLSSVDRGEIQVRARHWCLEYSRAFQALAAEVSRVGLSLDDLLQHVWRTQARQLRRVGLEIGEFDGSPGENTL